MPDQKHVVPTLVNTLAVNGFLNGIVNLAFSTAHWYPSIDAKSGNVAVAIAEPITVDLRMDLACAQATRDALDRIIEQNTKPTIKTDVN